MQVSPFLLLFSLIQRINQMCCCIFITFDLINIIHLFLLFIGAVNQYSWNIFLSTSRTTSCKSCYIPAHYLVSAFNYGSMVLNCCTCSVFFEIKSFFLLVKTLCMFLHPICTVCTQSVITCSNFTKETPEQDVKFIQVNKKDTRTMALASFWCFYF